MPWLAVIAIAVALLLTAVVWFVMELLEQWWADRRAARARKYWR